MVACMNYISAIVFEQFLKGIMKIYIKYTFAIVS